jgi:hypothetical protein
MVFGRGTSGWKPYGLLHGTHKASSCVRWHPRRRGVAEGCQEVAPGTTQLKALGMHKTGQAFFATKQAAAKGKGRYSFERPRAKTQAKNENQPH